MITSFANLSRELMNYSVDDDMIGKITKYKIDNERKKREKMFESRNLFANKSFDSRDYIISVPNNSRDFQNLSVP